MTKALALIALVLALTGCETYTGGRVVLDEGVSRVGEEARQISEDTLKHAQSYICRTARIESIMQLYYADEERWWAWLLLCGYGRPDMFPPPAREDPNSWKG